MAALNKLQQSTDPSSPDGGRKKNKQKAADVSQKSKDPSQSLERLGGQSIFYKDICIVRFNKEYG